MPLAIVLNIVLAILVVGGIVGLLGWAIASSRAHGPEVAPVRREPVRNPYRPRPHATRPQRAARTRTGRSEPVVG